MRIEEEPKASLEEIEAKIQKSKDDTSLRLEEIRRKLRREVIPGPSSRLQ